MYDFHTHSIFSDGELIPAELVRRCSVNGYIALAITDHVDISNIEKTSEGIIGICEELKEFYKMKIIPGVELTHIPPRLIERYVRKARGLGVKLVILHGETISEPVEAGTNIYGINSGIDILAHPGIISKEEAEVASKNGIYFELTSRKGHCLTNGYVAKIAKNFNVPLVINSDAHSPEDILTETQWQKVGLGAGLDEIDIEKVRKNSLKLMEKIGR